MRVESTESELVRAAVLVPIQLRAGGDHLVTLIRRSEHVSHHRGQIAFPGGRFDPGRDQCLSAAALREAHEEVGLPPEEVRLVGALPEIRTLTSRFLISPFVGVIPASFSFAPAPAEVDIVFTTRCSLLFGERIEIERCFEGRTVRHPAIPLDHGNLWGATLRIVDELARVLPRLLAP